MKNKDCSGEFHFEEAIILQNERLKLEPLEEKHFPLLLPIALREPNLLQYSPSPFGSEKDLKENFKIAFEQRAEKKRYAFAIYDRSAGKYAGSTSIGNFSIKDKCLQVGWTWIAGEFQGTGLNKNCKFLLLSYIFETLQYKRVEFVTDSRNLRSQIAISSIGGKYEGELRSNIVMKDGYRRNTRIYSILQNEWPEIKGKIFAQYKAVHHL